ncbi:MAG: nucleoside recognition domain-containing protein [Candidatus Coproplasma sp.]
MNAVFITICLISAIIMLLSSPTQFLPAMLSGGEDALKCAITLFCIYAFWMGLSSVAEEAKLTHGVAKLLTPFCSKLFKTRDGEAVKNIAMNLGCNLLGIGGAATPYAVSAINRLEKEQNYFAQNLLFIINATSIQLIPATVIALRSSLGSSSPHDITLPSFIATAVSTLCGVAFYMLYCKFKRR